MNIGEFGRLGTIENLLSHTFHFGLTKDKAKEIVRSILEKCLSWREYFENAGVTEIETEMFKNSFETRWKNVL